MPRINPLFLLVLLSSCGIYRSSFDCPAGKGLGCAPVGEVLDLIVEREEGEDVLVKDRGTALLLSQQEEEKSHPRRYKKRTKKLFLIKDESGEVVLVKEHESKRS